MFPEFQRRKRNQNFHLGVTGNDQIRSREKCIQMDLAFCVLSGRLIVLLFQCIFLKRIFSASKNVAGL